MSYLRLVIWDLVPNEIKESESHNALKFKIKRWSLKGVEVEHGKCILGKWGSGNIKNQFPVQ